MIYNLNEKASEKKSSKGITLIALVITVIVLLILAGISIAILTGENGILTQATKAKTATENASEEEQIRLAITAAILNVKNSMDKGILRQELEGIETLTGVPGDDSYNFPLIVTGKNGTIYEIDENGNLTVSDGSEPEGDEIGPGETAIGGNKNYNGGAVIPEGFTVSNITGETTVTGGLVIYDIPEANLASINWTADEDGNGMLDVQEKYNQFVWIPVDKTTFDTKFKRTEGYYNKSLQSKLSKCGEADATGVNSKITENDTVKNEAKNMYDSLKANGGFYIGRYEAGIEGSSARTSSSGITDNVVIKKNKYVYNYIAWSSSNTMTVVTGGAVEKSRNYNATSNPNGFKFANTNIKATTTLCYGVQWDAALNFIDPNYITNEKAEGEPNCSSDSYLVDSTDKGWYSNNCSTGNSAHKTGIDVNESKANMPKNIYDMAGNVYEWTMESYDTSIRVIRGGSYNDTGSYYPASFRNNNRNQSNKSDNYGFRLTLYL